MKVHFSRGTFSLLQKSLKILVSPGEKVEVFEDSPKVIDWPGEYEVSGVSIRGVSEQNQDIAFVVGTNLIRILFPQNTLVGSVEQNVQHIGNVDVVCLFPEVSSWSVRDWKKMLEEVDPRIVFFCGSEGRVSSLQKELGIPDMEKDELDDLSPKAFFSEKTRYIALLES
jgi:hypothetical protein